MKLRYIILALVPILGFLGYSAERYVVQTDENYAIVGPPGLISSNAQSIATAVGPKLSINASNVTAGVFPIARLATGTPDGTKFVRDDGTLAVPAGGGGGAAITVDGGSDQSRVNFADGADIEFTLTGTNAVASIPAALDLGGKTSFEIPNGASPTTDAFGELAGDNNAWASGRGAVQFYDGTANTWLVGALASDTPSNGQVPTWNTGGTITWETPSAGGASIAVDGTNVSSANLKSGWSGTFSVASSTNISFIPKAVQSTTTSSWTPDFSSGRVHQATLNGNLTLNAPSNVSSDMVGQTFTLIFVQDGTGGRTITSATNYLFGTDITGITLTTNASYRDYVTVMVRGTSVFDVIGVSRGYSP